MNDETPPADAQNRLRILRLAFLALFAILAGRAVQLSFAEPPQTTTPAPRAAERVRADLEDRNGLLLATTIKQFRLVASPREVFDAAQAARRLGEALPGADVNDIAQKIKTGRGRVTVARGLTASQRQAIHDLGLAGFEFEAEPRRVYPNEELAAHALGFVNADLEGQAGAERGLESTLWRVGAAGRPVRLSLDVRVQYALERELSDAAISAKAKRGAALIMDGRTGELLAIASWPGVNPNDLRAGEEERRINHAVASVWEMGSTVKPLIVAAALDAGLANEAELFDPSRPLAIGGAEIRDPHPFAGPMTLREAVAHSSNVALASLGLRLGARRQRDYLAKFGLLERAPVEIAFSAAPLAPANASDLAAATISYGHGISVSPLALASAYSAFVNDGQRVTPTILRREDGDPPPLKRALTAGVAPRVVELMRDVVLEGTARSDLLLRLDIAGKTGTAEKPGPNGYDPDRVFANFVAIFPASAPRYVIFLGLDEPQRVPEHRMQITGGALAAPAVGRIAINAAPFLDGVRTTSWNADKQGGRL